MATRRAHAVVIRTAGTNCDREMCRAFELAGASVDLVHLDRLGARPERLDSYDLVGFPGGFSYGDDVASGRLYAMRVRERLWSPLKRALERGVPMIGACNGFQVMTQVGLLPGPATGEAWASTPPDPTLALTWNDSGRYIDRWVGFEVARETSCVWTEGLDPDAPRETMVLPVAHAEGRLVLREGDTPEDLLERGHVALRYTEPLNGSAGSIAGVTDASGRLLGLMPHPERYLAWTHHPFWTRLDEGVRTGETPGLTMFRSAVRAAEASVV